MQDQSRKIYFYAPRQLAIPLQIHSNRGLLRFF